MARLDLRRDSGKWSAHVNAGIQAVGNVLTLFAA
jgi:hypothetical protein